MDLKNVNSIVAKLQPYKPGKPIEEVARELGLSDIVKLASNENPLGVSPKVQDAISNAASALTRYPDGNGYILKKALSEKLRVNSDQLTLGNGSNDVLDLIARATLDSESEGLISEHSFVVYGLAIKCAGARLVTVPAKNYGCNLSAMLEAITERTRLIYIANPNNPTGTWVNEQDLCDFLDKVPASVWVVLDEAYFEYVHNPSYPDGVALHLKYRNLIVTRTFSKAYGLAALRVGYSISSYEFADLLNRVRHPFNVNSMAMVAAVSALGDEEFVGNSIEVNEKGMRQLCLGLENLDLKFIPSIGNFVSFDTGSPGLEVFERMLANGVIVRPIAEYGLPSFLRVTVGLEDENSRFLDVLGAIL